MSVCLYVCVSWGHLDVWGELASHKRSLTHRPSSQGWASRCPLLYTFLCLGHGLGWLPFFSFLFSYASVLNTCISMYIPPPTKWRERAWYIFSRGPCHNLHHVVYAITHFILIYVVMRGWISRYYISDWLDIYEWLVPISASWTN